ncbi:MAG: hypothetical protein KC501_31135 [Myxococcales bacterium]|nr:hypothetical protein [Myxococcales bacterium]
MLRDALRMILLTAVLSASACSGEPLSAEHAQFAGRWVGPGVDLEILPEGHVHWVRVEGKSRVEIEGPLQGWIDGDFVVGVMVVKTRFDVTEPPHEVDGGWVMTVDGVQLTRVEER